MGVNGAGYESANDQASALADVVPWLQDTEADDVWNAWTVGYRDVRVLDELNRVVAVFNLTTNDLNVPANYDALKTILLDAAGE